MGKWTKRKCVKEETNYKGPAVYKIHLVDEKGKPFPIERFLVTDNEGVLCIGSTNNLEQRKNQFVSASENGKWVHSEGILLYLIKNKSSFKKYKNYELKYRFCKQKSKKKAKKEEEKLIKKYVKRFGEVPPLNSAIPNKRGNWNSY